MDKKLKTKVMSKELETEKEDIKQFEEDRFELTIENLLEGHQYRKEVILKGFETPEDILDGLLYEFKLTVREIERIQKQYNL